MTGATTRTDVLSSGAAADSEGLVRRVLSGEDRNLQVFAAEGLLPIEPQALASLQLSLRLLEDPDVAELATRSLQETDPRILCELVATADPEALGFLSEHIRHPIVLQEVLERPELAPELLGSLASWLPEELQELLLQRQDDIRSHPEILVELEKNPLLSPFSQRLIAEYRRHLLPDSFKRPERPVEPQPEEDLPSASELEEAIDTVAAEIAADGEMDEQTGLSEMQIRALPAGARMKLTYGASRTLRNILIRDNSPQVAVAALTNSSISVSEVEGICESRNVVQEVLSEIARNRRWMARYGVVVALVRNPRMPDGIGKRHLPRLAVRDLRALSFDRGVSQAMRTMARRILVQKTS